MGWMDRTVETLKKPNEYRDAVTVAKRRLAAAEVRSVEETVDVDNSHELRVDGVLVAWCEVTE